MRINYLLYALGIVTKYVGIMLFVPILVAVYYKDFYSTVPFLSIGLISVIFGVLTKKIACKNCEISNLNDIKKSEALL